MIKILYILGKWSNGGIEKVISEYSLNLTKFGYSIDIFSFEIEDSIFSEKLKEMGIKFFYPKYKISDKGYIKKNLERFTEISKIIENNYDIIHYHTSYAISFLHMFRVKRNTKAKIIIHSHGDNVNSPHILIKKIVNYVLKNLFSNVPDYCLATSEASGRWLFSRRKIKTNKYEVILNPINFMNYRFNILKREKYRNEWQIKKNQILIGTIGRIEYQKNPYFILNIIKGLTDKNFDFKFVWIGNGESKKTIVSKSKELKIFGKIVFIDSFEDIQGALSSFDFMILPSIYEGLGLVLLESQANGLITLASNTVPNITKISNKILYLTISNYNDWIEKIMALHDTQNDRNLPLNFFSDNGFDSERIVYNIREIYSNLLMK